MPTPRTGNGRRRSSGKRVNAEKYGQSDHDVEIVEHAPAPKAGPKKNGDARNRRPTQADVLIELAEAVELFHAPDGTGFADIEINGHRETWPLRYKSFRRWLAMRYYETQDGAPSSEAIQQALNVIEAKAQFHAPERTVHIRVAGLDHRLYLDLCDDIWRVVEIDGAGWRVIENPPVRFRRSAGMQRLPIPLRGGSIDALRPFLNVASDSDFVLTVSFVVAALRDRGPYPGLGLGGEQGTAKSTFSAILRALVDPNTAPLRALPREDRDLFIAANNSHMLVFDNVSRLPEWISDTLCRLATGGGFATRQLHSDQDEVLFDACRPVILNGIENMVDRPDLADRYMLLTLEPIPEERRRPEEEFRTAFEIKLPYILGALLDMIVHGLRNLPNTKLNKLPRMADFAKWATACEGAVWLPGTFWRAYCGNLDDAVEGVIEANPVADAVRTFMTARAEWTGTSKVLLGALDELVGEQIRKAKNWPNTPQFLSGKLRRVASTLRKVGIAVEFPERTRRARNIHIRNTNTCIPIQPEYEGEAPSSSSPSSPGADDATFAAVTAQPPEITRW